MGQEKLISYAKTVATESLNPDATTPEEAEQWLEKVFKPSSTPTEPEYEDL